jgi:hypothetical protein
MGAKGPQSNGILTSVIEHVFLEPAGILEPLSTALDRARIRQVIRMHERVVRFEKVLFRKSLHATFDGALQTEETKDGGRRRSTRVGKEGTNTREGGSEQRRIRKSRADFACGKPGLCGSGEKDDEQLCRSP